MSKITTLLALMVASAAMFALPSAGSAQEIHLEGMNSFQGTAGASSLTAESEPVITCESADVEGTVETGGTTGKITLDFTGCHSNFLGATINCRTSGSPIVNTIVSSGSFHLITISSLKPGILVTPAVTTIVCAGISNTITGGNIIGTMIIPACNEKSALLAMKFAATGATQEHTTYTGSTFHLTAQTSGGSVKDAGFVSTATVTSTTAGKLNCT